MTCTTISCSTVPLSMGFPTGKVSLPGDLLNSRTEKVSEIGVSESTSPPRRFLGEITTLNQVLIWTTLTGSLTQRFFGVRKKTLAYLL